MRRLLPSHRVLSSSQCWVRGGRLARRREDEESAELERRLPSASPDALLRGADVSPAAERSTEQDEELRRSHLLNTRERQTQHSFRPERVDPATTTIFLFPGQGSQFVGMGKSCLTAPHVQAMFDRASELLKYDLLKLCMEGPMEELSRTIHCQPAVFVSSLAAVQKMQVEEPRAISRCVSAAGMSVGEYAALVFAGSLGFEDGVRLVAQRAAAMNAAAEATPSGLLSIAVPAKANFSQATSAAIEFARKGVASPVCDVSTHLFTQYKVVGGNEECLAFLEQYGRKEYHLGPMKRLRVSGAFHTLIMKEAADEFREALHHTRFGAPNVPVISNFDARPFPKDEREIRKRLYKGVFRSVRWEQSMKALLDRASGAKFPQVYEVGPGSQLKAILSRTNLKAGRAAVSVEC